MEEFKKQSLNDYLAYMTTKKLWLSIWALLGLNGLLLAQFIYTNGQGFNIPVIITLVIFGLMILSTALYGINLRLYTKKKLHNSSYLILNSNVCGCFLTFCSTSILIARSFCATQGSNLVFANFAFIMILPIIFRIKRIPYFITTGISYLMILSVALFESDKSYLSMNTAFFFLVVYASALLNEYLITTSLNSTYNYQNKAYEVAEVQLKVSHELLKINDKLNSESTSDFLTQLGNRKALVNDSNLIWDECQLNHNEVSVAMIDIDSFKYINDTYGHKTGDVVLKRLAQLISENSISNNGLAYRYGGEEFLMIFKGASLKQTQEYMKNLSKEISLTSFSEIDNRIVTVSIGIYTDYPTNKNSINDFITEADKLMYQEKNKKKNKSLR